MSLQNEEIQRYATCVKSDTANNLRIMAGTPGLGVINANRVWVGASGTLVIESSHGDNITFSGTIAGRWHKLPLDAIRIKDATTATGIVIGTTV